MGMPMNGQPDSDRQPALLQNAAFVVQLRNDTSFADGRLCGRIEHVRTGLSTSFQSLAALIAFMGEHAGTDTVPGEHP